MPKTINKFEAVGRVQSITRNSYGNVYIGTTIEQANGKEINPDFYVADPEIPINISVGGLVYFKGHIRERAIPGEDGKLIWDQVYYVEELSEAHPSKDYHKSDQFLNIKLQGKLAKIMDSGHGWKKIILTTSVIERGQVKDADVIVSYYASSDTLIRIRDLDIGCTYEVRVRAVTPKRIKDGKEVKFSNLEAIFSRLVPERAWRKNVEEVTEENETDLEGIETIDEATGDVISFAV